MKTKKRITLTIDQETLDRLLKAAKQERRSLSMMAQLLIELGLETKNQEIQLK